MRYIDFIPASAPVSMEDPCGHDYKRMFFYVATDTLDRSVPKDPNPREQNINTRVAGQIATSLKSDESGTDQLFHLANRGLLVLADRVEASDGRIRVYLPEQKEHDVAFGLADGGTTYEVIKAITSQKKTEKYVTVEVISDLPADLRKLSAKLVQARNTSVQVHEESLQNHSGLYEFIKDSLAGYPEYKNAIKYKENASGRVPVRDLLTIMTLVCPEIKPEGKERFCHGPNVYGQHVVFRLFEANHEKYLKFQSQLPYFLHVFEYIGLNAHKVIKKLLAGKGKPGRYDIFDDETPWGGKVAPFSCREIDGSHKWPVKALWFALYGAFRQLAVEIEEGSCYAWNGDSTEMCKIFDNIGGQMVSKAKEVIEDTSRDADGTARKSYLLWEATYNILKEHIRERVLRSMMAPDFRLQAQDRK